MIGSDFRLTVLPRSRRCGECSGQMIAGREYLASFKGAKIMKWVCSQTCRMDFDDRVWQEIADKNQKRRKP